MSNQAPVCVIQPVISNEQPTAPNFPSIPQATDLASAISAINAISAILRTLTNQSTNNGSGTTLTSTKKKPPPPGRYVEQTAQRVVNSVTVRSSADPSTTLTFKRIDGLTFKDSKTGELWGWSRGSG